MSAKRLNLPDTASVARPLDNGKLHAPSAVRNRDAILATIRGFIPARGKALEIASGTGEHVIHYAAAFPEVSWQPTDIDPDRIVSIAAWCDEAQLHNILSPILLDSTVKGWAAAHSGQDVIILSNLLHLISEPEALCVISEAAEAIVSGGVMLVYGPFLRGSVFASESDRAFHDSLHGQDAEIGYKSLQDIQSAQERAGLVPIAPIEMPANNLLLVARKH